MSEKFPGGVEIHGPIDAAFAQNAGKYEQGAKLFEKITTDDNYVEFLTLPAYDLID